MVSKDNLKYRHSALVSLRVKGDRMSLSIDESKSGKHDVVSTKGAKLIIKGDSSFLSLLSCQNPICGCKTHPFKWFSESKGLVYYEVPKAASSSVRNILKLKYNIEDRLCLLLIKCIQQNLKSFGIVWDSPLEYLLIKRKLNKSIKRVNKNLIEARKGLKTKGHARLIPFSYGGNWQSYTQENTTIQGVSSFGIVRDPFSRLISNWRMFTSNPKRMTWTQQAFGKTASKITLHEFVERLGEINNHHWLPQVNYLPIKNHRVSVTHLLKMERITEDWSILATKFALPKNLGKYNITNRANQEPSIPKELRNKIIEYYQRDFELIYPEL